MCHKYQRQLHHLQYIISHSKKHFFISFIESKISKRKNIVLLCDQCKPHQTSRVCYLIPTKYNTKYSVINLNLKWICFSLQCLIGRIDDNNRYLSASTKLCHHYNYYYIVNYIIIPWKQKYFVFTLAIDYQMQIYYIIL